MPRRRHCCGEAREIADDTAAEGKDDIATLEFRRQQALDYLTQPRHRLRGFAIGDGNGGVGETRRIERPAEPRQLLARHFGIGDDAETPAREHGFQPLSGALEQVVADEYVIGALAERHMYLDRLSHVRPPLAPRCSK